MSPEAKERMIKWLDAQKDSPGKAIAKRVAETWLRDGEAAAQQLFRDHTRQCVLWERLAISDMVAAYREQLS